MSKSAGVGTGVRRVTDAELAELLRDCPTLYHMAERGSWPSIREHGLLSTSALLDLYGAQGAERAAIEGQRRPGPVTIERPAFGRAVIRDQKPMSDAGLRRCLTDGLTPEDWYRLLNGKVFFWLTRAPAAAAERRALPECGARCAGTRHGIAGGGVPGGDHVVADQ